MQLKLLFSNFSQGVTLHICIEDKGHFLRRLLELNFTQKQKRAARHFFSAITNFAAMKMRTKCSSGGVLLCLYCHNIHYVK